MNIQDLMQIVADSPITEWANNKTVLKSKPWLCYLSVTNICNSRCKVCAREKAMRKDKGSMSIDTFERILALLPESIKKVYLMKQGEPLLNKNLEYFIDRLHDQRPDIHLSFHTNGILMCTERMKKILFKIASLGISISAITRETYKNVHQVDKFDLVTKNLKNLSDLLISMPKKSRPHVFIDYVSQEANAHEDEQEVVNFFRKNFPGLSSVDVHWVFNFQGEIEEGNMKIYDELPHEKFPCCIFPWSAITFCHDGQVDYCFVEPRENKFLGNIESNSFEDIWNGTEYQNFRLKMTNKDFIGLYEDGFYCHKCAWLWSMHSQAPKNLSTGYSTDFTNKVSNNSFGHLLNSTHENIFQHGVDAYLAGEVHLAYGCFKTIFETGSDAALSNHCEAMITKCEKIFSKYNNLNFWNINSKKEVTTRKDKTSKFYPMN